LNYDIPLQHILHLTSSGNSELFFSLARVGVVPGEWMAGEELSWLFFVTKSIEG